MDRIGKSSRSRSLHKSSQQQAKPHVVQVNVLGLAGLVLLDRDVCRDVTGRPTDPPEPSKMRAVVTISHNSQTRGTTNVSNILERSPPTTEDVVIARSTTEAGPNGEEQPDEEVTLATVESDQALPACQRLIALWSQGDDEDAILGSTVTFETTLQRIPTDTSATASTGIVTTGASGRLARKNFELLVGLIDEPSTASATTSERFALPIATANLSICAGKTEESGLVMDLPLHSLTPDKYCVELHPVIRLSNDPSASASVSSSSTERTIEKTPKVRKKRGLGRMFSPHKNRDFDRIEEKKDGDAAVDLETRRAFNAAYTIDPMGDSIVRVEVAVRQKEISSESLVGNGTRQSPHAVRASSSKLLPKASHLPLPVVTDGAKPPGAPFQRKAEKMAGDEPVDIASSDDSTASPVESQTQQLEAAALKSPTRRLGMLSSTRPVSPRAKPPVDPYSNKGGSRSTANQGTCKDQATSPGEETSEKAAGQSVASRTERPLVTSSRVKESPKNGKGDVATTTYPSVKTPAMAIAKHVYANQETVELTSESVWEEGSTAPTRQAKVDSQETTDGKTSENHKTEIWTEPSFDSSSYLGLSSSAGYSQSVDSMGDLRAVQFLDLLKHSCGHGARDKMDISVDEAFPPLEGDMFPMCGGLKEDDISEYEDFASLAGLEGSRSWESQQPPGDSLLEGLCHKGLKRYDHPMETAFDEARCRRNGLLHPLCLSQSSKMSEGDPISFSGSSQTDAASASMDSLEDGGGNSLLSKCSSLSSAELRDDDSLETSLTVDAGAKTELGGVKKTFPEAAAVGEATARANKSSIPLREDHSAPAKSKNASAAEFGKGQSKAKCSVASPSKLIAHTCTEHLEDQQGVAITVATEARSTVESVSLAPPKAFNRSRISISRQSLIEGRSIVEMDRVSQKQKQQSSQGEGSTSSKEEGSPRGVAEALAPPALKKASTKTLSFSEAIMNVFTCQSTIAPQDLHEPPQPAPSFSEEIPRGLLVPVATDGDADTDTVGDLTQATLERYHYGNAVTSGADGPHAAPALVNAATGLLLDCTGTADRHHTSSLLTNEKSNNNKVGNDKNLKLLSPACGKKENYFSEYDDYSFMNNPDMIVTANQVAQAKQRVDSLSMDREQSRSTAASATLAAGQSTDSTTGRGAQSPTLAELFPLERVEL